MSVVLQASAPTPSESLLLDDYVMANNARFEENGLVSYSGVFLDDGEDDEEEDSEAQEDNLSHDSHLTDEEHSQHGGEKGKKGCK